MTTTAESDRDAADPASAPEPEPEAAGREDQLAEAFSAIVAQIQEIRTQLGRLIGIQLDRAQLKLRAAAFRILVAALAAAAILTATVGAVLYLLAGTTAALAILFGGRVWAGNLAGGVLMLALLCALLALGAKWRAGSEMRRLVAKYGRKARRPAR